MFGMGFYRSRADNEQVKVGRPKLYNKYKYKKKKKKKKKKKGKT